MMNIEVKIYNIINYLFTIPCFFNNLDRDKFLTDIYNMYYEDLVDYLLKKVYMFYLDGQITDDLLNEIMKKFECYKIFNTYIDAYDRIAWLRKMKLFDESIQLKKSHVEVLDTFDRLNLFLNSFNADFYHTSGILTYLLTNRDLVRYHHDLDIFINESDLSLLREKCKYSSFEFFEYLGKRSGVSKRRTVKLLDKENEIIVSVFLFERLVDNSVVVNDYYFDENGVLLMDQDYNSPRCVDLSFSNELHFHNDIPYKSITIEALYNCKKGRGVKHQFDCMILDEFVDFQLEKEIDTQRIEGKKKALVLEQNIINSMYWMRDNDRKYSK